MSAQPEALRLAEFCEGNVLYQPAAAELRRLYLVEQALERCKAVCDATSEGWRADAERWQAQRDALLEALIRCRNRFFPSDQPERDRDELWEPVNASIKAVEEK